MIREQVVIFGLACFEQLPAGIKWCNTPNFLSCVLLAVAIPASVRTRSERKAPMEIAGTSAPPPRLEAVISVTRSVVVTCQFFHVAKDLLMHHSASGSVPVRGFQSHLLIVVENQPCFLSVTRRGRGMLHAESACITPCGPQGVPSLVAIESF
jgi:hypothetical protein